MGSLRVRFDRLAGERYASCAASGAKVSEGKIVGGRDRGLVALLARPGSVQFDLLIVEAFGRLPTVQFVLEPTWSRRFEHC